MDDEVSTTHQVVDETPPSMNHPPPTEEDDVNITEEGRDLDASQDLPAFEEGMALWSVEPKTKEWISAEYVKKSHDPVHEIGVEGHTTHISLV